MDMPEARTTTLEEMTECVARFAELRGSVGKATTAA